MLVLSWNKVYQKSEVTETSLDQIQPKFKGQRNVHLMDLKMKAAVALNNLLIVCK